MKTLVLALIGLTGIAMWAQVAKGKKITTKRICLDSIAQVEKDGVRAYTLTGSCRVIIPMPDSLLSEGDTATLERMQNDVVSIVSFTELIEAGGDVKFGAMIAQLDNQFRQDRKDLCLRHTDMSLFDLNARSDEILAHPCADQSSTK
jgi:hypothetical protein